MMYCEVLILQSLLTVRPDLVRRIQCLDRIGMTITVIKTLLATLEAMEIIIFSQT